MQEWKESQQRLTAIFSASILKSKAFEKEELRFRAGLLNHLGTPQNLEERITRKLLQQEKRELEKRLYPNRMVRLIRRAVEFGRQQFRQGPVPAWEGNRSVSGQKAAFRSGQELSRLAARQTRRVSEEPLPARQEFTSRERFSESQQKNLLQGRSVEKKGRWFRLDLADMDTKGRFALKEIPFRFDLAEKLQKLPFTLQPQAVEKLREGERIAAQIPSASGDKTVLIEANPMMRSLSFYDEQQKRVTMKQAMGLQEAPTVAIGKQRKVSVSVG